MTDSPFTEQGALDVLRAIDRGEVTLRQTACDGANVDYEASNGWRFRVFDDVGQWDYVDAYAPPGREWVDVDGTSPVLWFNPSPEALRNVWRWAPDGVSPAGYRV